MDHASSMSGREKQVFILKRSIRFNCCRNLIIFTVIMSLQLLLLLSLLIQIYLSGDRYYEIHLVST
jgi:hypothetical protein